MDFIIDALLSREFIVPITIIIVSIFIYFIIHRVIRRVFSIKIKNARFNMRRQKTLMTVIDNICKYFIAIVALLMILDVYGIDTKSLLTSLGVVGLVAGLALQDLLKDLIAGFAIIFEDQYAVGDIVTIGDFKGTVTYLGIKSTRLVAFTGETLIVPNRNVDRVINHTLETNINFVDVDVAYSSDIDKVKKVLKEVLDEAQKELTFTSEPVVCGVNKLRDSGISMRVMYACKYDDKIVYERNINERIKKAFDKNGIEIPFPQVVIHNGK